MNFKVFCQYNGIKEQYLYSTQLRCFLQIWSHVSSPATAKTHLSLPSNTRWLCCQHGFRGQGRAVTDPSSELGVMEWWAPRAREQWRTERVYGTNQSKRKKVTSCDSSEPRLTVYSICAAVNWNCVYVLLQQISCTQFLCYGEWHAVWVDLQPRLNLLLRLLWAWWERAVKLLKEPTPHFSVLPLGPPLWEQTSLSTVMCSIRIPPILPATTMNWQFDTVKCGCENPHQAL